MSLVAIGGVAATVGVAIVGWLIQRWRNKKKLERQEEQELDNDIDKLESRVSTLWKYVFGREDDQTDGGVAQEIEDGFNKIEGDIEELNRKQETYHRQEMAQLRRLVNSLHDEEELEFEREDVFTDKEDR